VVVQVHFPDAQYSGTSTAESYPQLLGAKAAVVTQGTPAEVAIGNGTAEAGLKGGETDSACI